MCGSDPFADDWPRTARHVQRVSVISGGQWLDCILIDRCTVLSTAA
jgi:hypothetical protein